MATTALWNCRCHEFVFSSSAFLHCDGEPFKIPFFVSVPALPTHTTNTISIGGHICVEKEIYMQLAKQQYCPMHNSESPPGSTVHAAVIIGCNNWLAEQTLSPIDYVNCMQRFTVCLFCHRIIACEWVVRVCVRCARCVCDGFCLHVKSGGTVAHSFNVNIVLV